MLRNHRLRLVLMLAVALRVEQASAAHFSIIANLEGAPQIGAVNHKILYGTFKFQGDGALFSLTEKGGYSLLHAFAGDLDGQYPNAKLAIDAKGGIYGTAPKGGANNAGTVWEYSAHNGFTALHSFGNQGDGIFPNQGPTILDKSTIVGTASQGAINDNGNIFSIAAKHNTYTVLYEFLSGNDGHCPFAGVAVSDIGTIYGMTTGLGWGGNPNGSVWEFATKTGLQTVYVFQNGSDGEWPDQAPVLDHSGNIFGTTHIQNGASFAGAIWKISAAGDFTILHDLDGITEGFEPNSPLLLDLADGNLYGTTSSGGYSNYGTIFKISPSGAFTVLHSFTGGSDGAVPTGNLVQDAKGVIFGGTDYGSVFKIKP